MKIWDVGYVCEKGLKIKLFVFGMKKENEVIGFVVLYFIEFFYFVYNVENEFNVVVVEVLFFDW